MRVSAKVISALFVSLLVSGPAPALPQDGDVLVKEALGAPLRVRDYTFPSYLNLSFAPQPAAPLGRGRWAVEGHYSVVNNFQASSAVEEYLKENRQQRRRLDAADAEFILGLPRGQGFFIDGEFDFIEFVLHYGLTDRLDLGIGAYYIGFSGGQLDGSIWDFHEQFGFGQQGRNFVVDNQFQIVIGQNGEGLALLNDTPSDGWGDPTAFLRYALGSLGRWKFNLAAGIKAPIAREPALSSGGWDVGLQLTADARWRRTALIFNLAAVEAEEYSEFGVDPPLLPSLNVAWMRSIGKDRKGRFVLQVLAAEHAFSDLFDSALTRPEFQVTLGYKRDTGLGVFGVGLTENVLAYDNTPDIGLHFSWGYLFE